MKKIKRSSKPTVTKKSPVESIYKQSSPNKMMILSIAVLTLVALLLVKNIFFNGTETLRKKTIPEAVKKILGNTTTEVNIGALKNSSGIYEFDLNIGKGTTARKYVSYITKDGKILFTSGIKLSELGKASTQGAQTEQKKLTCNDLDKAETAKLTAYVVSQCPFGLQMQRVFKKAIAELPSLEAQLDIKYIGAVENGKITSMHGDAEAQENLKQICIREEQKEKYWPYVSCYMEAGKSEECSATAGIDTTAVQTCMGESGQGLVYAQKDFDLANKFNIGSSPTLLLNDKQIVSEFDFGGRVANSLKEVVCCGSKTKGDYCTNKLTTDEVATAYSLTDAPAAGGSAAAANCAPQQ